jgi:hypothetical protein
MNRAKFAHCKNPGRSGIMTELMRSKKMILSLMGIAAVVALVGGFIAGIVASLNLGQGLADGLSEGRTSAGGGNR